LDYPVPLRSQTLEGTLAFPVGYGGSEGFDLDSRHVEVVFDNFLTESLAGGIAGCEEVAGLV
jgi:hypothetical protein